MLFAKDEYFLQPYAAHSIYIMSSRHFRIFNNLVSSSHLSIMYNGAEEEEKKHSLKGPQRPPHRSTRVSEIGPLLWPQSNIV